MVWKKHKRRQSQHKEQAQKAIKRVLAARVFLIAIFLILMMGNILIFAKSVTLSDNIVLLESDIVEVRKENEKLMKELYTVNSLNNLEKLADQLGFTKAAEPVYLDTPDYAFVQ